MDAIIIGLIIVVIIFLIKIVKQNKSIMATQAEQTAKLVAAADKAEKILKEVQALKTAYDNSGNSTPEMDAAFARIEAAQSGTDDLNADEVPPSEEV